MSEERERYQSGASEPELTPEQKADAVIMTETEEEMTPEDAARHFLSGFDWDGETTERIDTIHDDLAEVIREAEERGRVAERKACADAICAGCREGEALGQNAYGGFMHKHSVEGCAYGCAASAIHALPTTPAEEKG